MIGWELTGQVKMAPRGCAHYTDDQWINRQFPVDHFGFVCSAAYDAMKKWRVNGTPAPKADRITESGTPLAVVQDKYGNALGGIRTPYMVVPTALWGSSETGTPGPCSSYMYMIPFTSDVLKGLYTDHNDYVTKFTAAANALVTSGFWLKEDAQNAIAEATSAKIP